MKRTPPLYATGKWELLTPFTINPNAIYICKALRTFDELKAADIDPYKTYYEFYGIDRATYDQDVLDQVNIVVLMSPTDAPIAVPDSYIASFPDLTEVPYSHVVLSISLGAVPDTLALEDVKTKISEVVLNSVGIESVVREHQASSIVESVPQQTHETFERNRLQRIESNETFYAMYLSARDENVLLKEKIQLLEQIIIDAGLLNP